MPSLAPRAGILAALAIGFLVGALSSFGDGAPVTVVNALANAAGPWLIGAFFAGALQTDHRRGAVAGVAALLVAFGLYYGRIWLAGNGLPVALALGWLVLTVAVGPTMGMVGAAWVRRGDRWRTVAVSLLAAGLLAEAAHRFILLEAWDGIDLSRTYMQLAVANTVIAVALPLTLLERRRWLPAFASALALGTVSLVILLGVAAVFAALSGR